MCQLNQKAGNALLGILIPTSLAWCVIGEQGEDGSCSLRDLAPE